MFHTSDTFRQFLAIPPVTDPRLSPGMPTRRMVTTIESNDLVVGEDYLL